MPRLVLRKAKAFKDTSVKHVTSKKLPVVHHNIVPTRPHITKGQTSPHLPGPTAIHRMKLHIIKKQPQGTTQHHTHTTYEERFT